MPISKFSQRRIKLVSALSLFTAVLSLIWYFIAHEIGMLQLSYYIGTAALVFIISAILAKKQITLARTLYMLAFVLGVSVTSSFIGKPGSVEFILIFAMGLPFLMFSFRREKTLVIIFSSISIVFWVLLYATDFNLFTNTKVDPEIASSFIYPISILSTIGLIGYELFHFSSLNLGYYNKLNNKREEAVEASNSKSRFLSAMSHEIRTPLNAVIGLSYILQDTDPRPDQKDNIEALHYSGEILLSLINDVLDFSKMESTTIELDAIPTNISKAVKQIKKMHEASCLKKNIELKLKIDKDLPIVLLDVVRFNQVVNNLVSNAIKFTEKGSVTLRIKKIAQSDKTLTILTEIEDTGIGIPFEAQKKIWEPFSQASQSTNRLYGGTGLGLPIVKSIVEAMNSEVNLESTVGKGSRFYFEMDLEIASEDVVKLDDKKHKLDFNLKGKRVLLVEDNEINVMVAKQIIQKANLKVDVAYDGLQAVNMVKENNYDIVLMDIQMPIMDGYTASKEIRQFNQAIPILALSASVFAEVKNKIQKSGMNGFIFKPFKPHDLLSHIEEALN